MKTPSDIAGRLAKQWQQPFWRVDRLLSADSWPLVLTIGKPTGRQFAEQTGLVQAHVQRWRQVAVGEVVWDKVRFRAAAEPVSLPVQWVLHQPSEWAAATDDAQVQQEFAALETLVAGVNRRYREVFVREPGLWRNKAIDELIDAARLADLMQPGMAEGRPLRLLKGLGVDTKFIERHALLLTRLLDERYDGMASQLGLSGFLNAPDDKDHWLLVVPLEKGLLPFQRQRITARELADTCLPGSRVVVVENERCEHLLPAMPDTVAILGAGLDLQWLAGAALQHKAVGYWGDMDTWGLVMLARARQSLPTITPLMMSETHFTAFCRDNAVSEPVPAELPTAGLKEREVVFFHFLKTQLQGRLEQEYLPVAEVQRELLGWLEVR
ncbi:Wadjet anti-phage system protein JetD domain-containing protein [Vreelandella subterranea]|nr:Wadjet anti-phage system protein JetD domain-containing protein [Halomonas subterranea]